MEGPAAKRYRLFFVATEVGSKNADSTAASLPSLSRFNALRRGLVRRVQYLPVLWLRLRVRRDGVGRTRSGVQRGAPAAAPAAFTRQAPTLEPQSAPDTKRASRAWGALFSVPERWSSPSAFEASARPLILSINFRIDVKVLPRLSTRCHPTFTDATLRGLHIAAEGIREGPGDAL